MLLAAALLTVGGPNPARAAATFVPIPDPAITTLLLHQVSDKPFLGAAGGEDTVKRPWVTPAEFDRLLSQAEAAGYHYVTFDQALGFFQHRLPASALPSKPLLLTFDDGYESAWLEGTPVMKKHRAAAVMFFEGQLTDVKAGRLTTLQLAEMDKSGLWSLQSHGFVGHGNIVIDAAGTRNPYWYANLEYLADKKRLETLDEYEARVEADLKKFKHTFEAKLHANIHVFAYPSGEFGQNAPLTPGADPALRPEAGHSNANGLTAHLFRALKNAGYDVAFAVSIYGITHPADLSNDILALPRVGVGADFEIATLERLQTRGWALPQIADGVLSDPGALAPYRGGLLVASINLPLIFQLDGEKRVVATYRVPELMDDRNTGGKHALISALLSDGDEITVVQQAGDWPNATPRLTKLRLRGDRAEVLSRTTLPSALNWLVGAVRQGSRIVGMTDSGALYELSTGAHLGDVAPGGSPAARLNRFAGPVLIKGDVRVYDRMTHELMAVASDGTASDAHLLPGDLRTFTSEGSTLYAVDWLAQPRRQVLDAYHIENGS